MLLKDHSGFILLQILQSDRDFKFNFFVVVGWMFAYHLEYTKIKERIS